MSPRPVSHPPAASDSEKEQSRAEGCREGKLRPVSGRPLILSVPAPLQPQETADKPLQGSLSVPLLIPNAQGQKRLAPSLSEHVTRLSGNLSIITASSSAGSAPEGLGRPEAFSFLLCSPENPDSISHLPHRLSATPPSPPEDATLLGPQTRTDIRSTCSLDNDHQH